MCPNVFQLTPSEGQWTLTIIEQFEGGGGVNALVLDKLGNLYGTTPAPGGCGLVFRLTPARSGWQEVLVHRFPSGNGDGCGPYGSLILDNKGNLYGTTAGGGSSGWGTVFAIKGSQE